jgi:isoleucyl-tRNA synthetase
LARELVSRVQRLRKETGLAVSDRIVLTIDGDAEVEASAREHRAWIAEEVLATLVLVAGEDGQGGRPAPRDARGSLEADVDGLALRVTLQKDDF